MRFDGVGEHIERRVECRRRPLTDDRFHDIRVLQQPVHRGRQDVAFGPHPGISRGGGVGLDVAMADLVARRAQTFER